MEKSGSTFKCPLTTIVDILPHGNAERLEIAVVFGFQVIVSKGQYTKDDEVIYVPVDSILSQTIEDKLFPPDSKVKLHHHRIRQIKLRGVASQGMLIHPNDVSDLVDTAHVSVGDDLAQFLGITKYEPPQREVTTGESGTKKSKPLENPHFHKYGGLDNIKWFPTKFKEDEQIVLQEKIHGTNCRAAVMPFVANTLWKKIKQYFGYAPISEFCFGSNNVQLQNKGVNNKGFYDTNYYARCMKPVENQLRLGETIYGEIYGDGVQTNYAYGLTLGVVKFILFDVKVRQPDGSYKWLNPDEVAAFAKERGFDMVPELYRGPFTSLDFVKTFTKGASVLAPSQKVREGVVVKSLAYDENGQNRALKIISEDYLADDKNTDFQ